MSRLLAIDPGCTESAWRFDIKTVSEANQREHWRTKHARKKQQQRDFALLWRQYWPVPGKFPVRPTITFTRYSCKELDADNLAGAFKHIQDQLAKEMGIDDGAAFVTWRYEQRRINKREHYFTVRMEG